MLNLDNIKQGQSIRYSLVERTTDLRGNNLAKPQYDLRIETEGQVVILPAYCAERLCDTYKKLIDKKIAFLEDLFYS